MSLEQEKIKKGNQINVISPNCTGCRLCSLACSFIYTKAFSLSDARIKVAVARDSYNFMVSFTDDCTRCGECANYCYNNVLSFSKG